MKKDIKFILSVVIFTTSIIITNNNVAAKVKSNTEISCQAGDDYICGITPNGEQLLGKRPSI